MKIITKEATSMLKDIIEAIIIIINTIKINSNNSFINQDNTKNNNSANITKICYNINNDNNSNVY